MTKNKSRARFCCLKARYLSLMIKLSRPMSLKRTVR